MKKQFNKRIGSVIGLVLILFAFSNCDKDRIFCQSYAVGYVKFDLGLVDETQMYNCIKIYCATGIPFVWYNMEDSGKEKEIYDELCRKHNDLTYNRRRKISPYEGILGSAIYPASDFKSIRITADRAFDAAHSAGDDLGDIIRFLSWSPIKYIKSGYTEYYHYDTSALSRTFIRVMPNFYGSECFKTETESTCFPVDKLVSDLEPEDLVMLGEDNPSIIGLLYFEKRPAVSGEYEITVSMTTDEDEVMTSSIRISL